MTTEQKSKNTRAKPYFTRIDITVVVVAINKGRN